MRTVMHHNCFRSQKDWTRAVFSSQRSSCSLPCSMTLYSKTMKASNPDIWHMEESSLTTSAIIPVLLRKILLSSHRKNTTVHESLLQTLRTLRCYQQHEENKSHARRHPACGMFWMAMHLDNRLLPYMGSTISREACIDVEVNNRLFKVMPSSHWGSRPT